MRRTGRPRASRLILAAAAIGLALYLVPPDLLLGETGSSKEEDSLQYGSTPKPGVANGLHPGLLAALDEARRAAAPAGHAIPVASGFRSVEKQLATLDEAIEKYGTREQAEHWVFPPERSMHTRGLAIDIGDGPSADWLLIHGGRFGLCKTLAWEWWHFEWRESWQSSGTCPAPVDSPDDAPPPDDGW